MATVEGDAVAPRVIPTLSSGWDLPRSTTTLPVHCVAHHGVVALPSTAFDAGVPVPAELAVAS